MVSRKVNDNDKMMVYYNKDNAAVAGIGINGEFVCWIKIWFGKGWIL